MTAYEMRISDWSSDLCSSDRRRGGGERDQVDLGGIEERDDDDRAHVVDDRDGDEEQLERGRRAPAKQREDADREGDVGRRRDRPALRKPRLAARGQHIEPRRYRHPRRGGDHRPTSLVPRSEERRVGTEGGSQCRSGWSPEY